MDIAQMIIRVIPLGKETPAQDAIHVVVGIDKNYARPMGVLMTSIFKTNEKIAFHIFADELSVEDQERIRVTSKKYDAFCAWYVVDPTPLASLPTMRLTTAAYFRLVAGEYFSRGNLARIIYLDSDMICIGSLRSLFSTDLKGKSVAAVKDPGVPAGRCQRIGHTGDGYFNSGFLMIDTNAWRRLNIFSEAVRLRSENPLRFETVDQDILNLLFANDVFWLPKKYNQENNVHDEYPDETVILHYTSTPKPWLAWYYCSGRNYWAEVAAESEWKGLPPVLEPRSTRETRLMSRASFQRGDFIKGISWYLKYLQRKITGTSAPPRT